MRQDFLFSKKQIGNVVKWVISFLISIIIMLMLITILTLVQKQFRFDEHILRIILIVFFSVSAGICAYLFRRFSSIKGYLSGLVTSIIFIFLKLTLSLLNGGVGKSNFMVFFTIVPAALIGGILSANRKNKTKF